MVSKISGIYAYYDNSRCEIVYVGRDSHIDENRRDRDHYAPSNRDEQQINRVLQNDNNSGRYSYVILEKGCFTDDELNQKEISWISFFNPRFNFTDGGEGIRGYKHSEETWEKISRALSGKNHPFYGKKHSEEARKKMSENHADVSRENHPRFDSCIKIRKQKSKTYKQGFCWHTLPYTSKKQIHISSVDLQKCIEKVEDFLKSEKNVYGYTSYEVVDE